MRGRRVAMLAAVLLVPVGMGGAAADEPSWASKVVTYQYENAKRTAQGMAGDAAAAADGADEKALQAVEDAEALLPPDPVAFVEEQVGDPVGGLPPAPEVPGIEDPLPGLQDRANETIENATDEAEGAQGEAEERLAALGPELYEKEKFLVRVYEHWKRQLLG